MQTTNPAPVYYVRSDSNPALFYTVAAVDGRCRCGQQTNGLGTAPAPTTSTGPATVNTSSAWSPV